jgi:hypothetical protein
MAEKPLDREESVDFWLRNGRRFLVGQAERGVFVGKTTSAMDETIRFVVALWRSGSQDDLSRALSGQTLNDGKLVMSYGLSAEAARIILEELAKLHGYELVSNKTRKQNL